MEKDTVVLDVSNIGSLFPQGLENATKTTRLPQEEEKEKEEEWS